MPTLASEVAQLLRETAEKIERCGATFIAMPAMGAMTLSDAARIIQNALPGTYVGLTLKCRFGPKTEILWQAYDGSEWSQDFKTIEGAVEWIVRSGADKDTTLEQADAILKPEPPF